MENLINNANNLLSSGKAQEFLGTEQGQNIGNQIKSATGIDVNEYAGKFGGNNSSGNNNSSSNDNNNQSSGRDNNNDSFGSSNNQSYGRDNNDSFGSSGRDNQSSGGFGGNDSYGSSNQSFGGNNDSFGSSGRDNQSSGGFGGNNSSSDSYGSSNNSSSDAYGNQGQSGQYGQEGQYGSGRRNQSSNVNQYEDGGAYDSTSSGGYGGDAFSRQNQMNADNARQGYTADDDNAYGGGYKTGTSTPGYRQEGDVDGQAAENRVRNQNLNTYGQQADDRGSRGNDYNEAI